MPGERVLCQRIQRATSEEEMHRTLLAIPLRNGVVSYYAADATLHLPETWPCGEPCVRLALQRMLGRGGRALKSRRNLACCARIMASEEVLDPRDVL